MHFGIVNVDQPVAQSGPAVIQRNEKIQLHFVCGESKIHIDLHGEHQISQNKQAQPNPSACAAQRSFLRAALRLPYLSFSEFLSVLHATAALTSPLLRLLLPLLSSAFPHPPRESPAISTDVNVVALLPLPPPRRLVGGGMRRRRAPPTPPAAVFPPPVLRRRPPRVRVVPGGVDEGGGAGAGAGAGGDAGGGAAADASGQRRGAQAPSRGRRGDPVRGPAARVRGGWRRADAGRGRRARGCARRGRRRPALPRQGLPPTQQGQPCIGVLCFSLHPT
jgi:hypothetical protein